MFLNNETQLNVFETDKYDDMNLKSAWKKMKKPSIVLTSIPKEEPVDPPKEPSIESPKEEAEEIPKSPIAFHNMSIEKFAKQHFKGNRSKEIWGALMFYMQNYKDDCFPQAKITIPKKPQGQKDYSALKLIWKGTIRSQKNELKSYFKLNYPEGLFQEAKKCMEDKTKRFVLFYMALQINDPTLDKPIKEIMKKLKTFYMKQNINKKTINEIIRLSFIFQLWTKKGDRIKQISKLLTGRNLIMPSINIQVPEKIKPKDFQYLRHAKTKELIKPGDKLNTKLSGASNATFSLENYPLKIRYEDPNFLNKNEIIQWYEKNVEPLVSGQGHANLLLLDTHTGELERFEPHGMKSLSIYKENELDQNIKKTFSEKLGVTKYYKPEHICPDAGPQKRQERERREELKDLKDIVDLESGTCVAWTMFYGDLRLRNPDIPREEVIEMGLKHIHDQPQALTRYIVNFMYFLKDAWLKLDDPKWVQEILEQF